MKRVLLLLVLLSLPASATELNCNGAANIESFKYTWRMRGGLSWIAGILFPTSGVDELKNTFAEGPAHISSSLLITAPTGTKGGFYAYESQMDQAGKTLMTYHAYSWRDKSRKERAVFDYATRQAHLHRETPEAKVDKTKPM